MSGSIPAVIYIVAGAVYFTIVGPIIFAGLKVLKPNEALVLTLFGKYYGTLKGDGFFFVNPFVSAVNPAATTTSSGVLSMSQAGSAAKEGTQAAAALMNKKISLKAMTLNNDKQKINDQLGNPIIIGIAVIWKVVNTAKAVFNVDNYTEYLSIQCDAALRNIVRLYPYDTSGDDNGCAAAAGGRRDFEKRNPVQVEIAGCILEAGSRTSLMRNRRAMLQQRQASAIIDASRSGGLSEWWRWRWRS